MAKITDPYDPKDYEKTSAQYQEGLGLPDGSSATSSQTELTGVDLSDLPGYTPGDPLQPTAIGTQLPGAITALPPTPTMAPPEIDPYAAYSQEEQARRTAAGMQAAGVNTSQALQAIASNQAALGRGVPMMGAAQIARESQNQAAMQQMEREASDRQAGIQQGMAETQAFAQQWDTALSGAKLSLDQQVAAGQMSQTDANMEWGQQIDAREMEMNEALASLQAEISKAQTGIERAKLETIMEDIAAARARLEIDRQKWRAEGVLMNRYAPVDGPPMVSFGKTGAIPGNTGAML